MVYVKSLVQNLSINKRGVLRHKIPQFWTAEISHCISKHYESTGIKHAQTHCETACFTERNSPYRVAKRLVSRPGMGLIYWWQRGRAVPEITFRGPGAACFACRTACTCGEKGGKPWPTAAEKACRFSRMGGKPCEKRGMDFNIVHINNYYPFLPPPPFSSAMVCALGQFTRNSLSVARVKAV